MQQNTQNGFTLIEVMIVVLIIGILGGIGYPSYQDSMTKSRRADAKSALLELSVFMERYYTANGCYTSGSCVTGTTTAPTLPFLVTPKSGKANYNLAVATTPSTFTLTATLIRAADDSKCGSLTLDNTNAKSTSTAAAISDATAKGALIADCW